MTWLKENWENMMDTVVTLASNVGHEAKENAIGTLSKKEAKEALRKHKGNMWAAVTECVEQRKAKVILIHIISISFLNFIFNSLMNSVPRATLRGMTS